MVLFFPDFFMIIKQLTQEEKYAFYKFTSLSFIIKNIHVILVKGYAQLGASMNTENKKYETMSIVLVGDFQPNMFQPYWFLQNEIITQNEYDSILNNKDSEMLITSGLSSFETGILGFRITQDRFQIIGKNEPFEKAIDAFKKTFDNLSTFSVKVYGINFTFHLESDEKEMETLGKNLAPRSYWESLWNKSSIQNDKNSGLLSMAIRKKETFGEINVSIESSKLVRGVFLNFNFHHINADNQPFCVADIETDLDQKYEAYRKKVYDFTEDLISKATK